MRRVEDLLRLAPRARALLQIRAVDLEVLAVDAVLEGERVGPRRAVEPHLVAVEPQRDVGAAASRGRSPAALLAPAAGRGRAARARGRRRVEAQPQVEVGRVVRGAELPHRAAALEQHLRLAGLPLRVRAVERHRRPGPASAPMTPKYSSLVSTLRHSARRSAGCSSLDRVPGELEPLVDPLEQRPARQPGALDVAQQVAVDLRRLLLRVVTLVAPERAEVCLAERGRDAELGDHRAWPSWWLRSAVR